MPYTLRGRSMLSLVHHTERDLTYLLDLSRDLKRAKYAGTEPDGSQGVGQGHRPGSRSDV